MGLKNKDNSSIKFFNYSAIGHDHAFYFEESVLAIDYSRYFSFGGLLKKVRDYGMFIW